MTTFAILAYEGIEPIDIGATYGVLSMARRIVPELKFFVVAVEAGELEMANGLKLVAEHGYGACPAFDIVIVLGGPGWVTAREDAATLAFLRTAAGEGKVIASVCTGAMILAAAGLLDGKSATTKVEVFAGETPPLDLLQAEYPIKSAVKARIVDEGQIITGGGVALGIDMTLHLISRFVGREAAHETARVLEYGAGWDANAARLPDHIREDQ